MKTLKTDSNSPRVVLPKQHVNGILLVNKPIGLTSNAVLQRVKHLLHAYKAGHTGSLDPLATGMLPICFGEATKFSQYLLDADKCYEVTGLLGIKTNTADATGEIIQRCDDFNILEAQLRAVLDTFVGEIKQIPSMFSALKHQGQPLYRYARAGIEIERPARPVTIRQLHLNAFDGQQFKLMVVCSKGTYIRNLVEDIGDCLGVGAHVTQLHRRYTMGFEHEIMFGLEELNTQSMEQLLDALLPMDRAVIDLPQLVINAECVHLLRQGQTVNVSMVPSKSSCVRLYTEERDFIGLGDVATEGLLKVRRLLSTQSN